MVCADQRSLKQRFVSWLVPTVQPQLWLLRATAKDSAGFTAVAVTAQPLSIVRGTNPPTTPFNPFPLAGGINVPFTAPVLSWQSGDLAGNSLTYQVKFGTNATPSFFNNFDTAVFRARFFGPSNHVLLASLRFGMEMRQRLASVVVYDSDWNPGLTLLFPQTMTTNGAFKFQFSGIFGETYALQASTNLVNWVTITNVVVTETPALAIDRECRELRFRFYRLADQIGGPTIYISSFQRLPNHANTISGEWSFGQLTRFRFRQTLLIGRIFQRHAHEFASAILRLKLGPLSIAGFTRLISQ